MTPRDNLAAAPSLSTQIVTDRLVLRPARTSDVARMRFALRRNASHLRPWTPTPKPGDDPWSLTSVSQSVLAQRREWKAGQAFAMLLFPREDDGRVIGRIALGAVRRGPFQNAYLGYWIDFERQGHGLMTEAVAAATSFAFGPAGLHRVQAAVMPDNAASLRVLEKAGYRKEGTARNYLNIAGQWADHVLYAVTIEDWSPAARRVRNDP